MIGKSKDVVAIFKLAFSSLNITLLFVFVVGAIFSIPVYAKNTVVLELFTSQLCQNASMGDDLFQEIVERDMDIIAVSCHVQDFNVSDIEKDDLSKKFCDERKRTYEKILLVRGASVPLMVVNGHYDMNGTRRSLVEAGIALARSEGGVQDIELRADQDHLEINLTAQDIQGNSDIWLFAYDHVQHAKETTYTHVAQHLVHIMSWDGEAQGLSFPLQDIKADGYTVLVQNDTQGIVAAGTIKIRH